MTALTQDRDTKTKGDNLRSSYVAGGVKIFAGALTCLNSSGYAVPGSTAAGLKALGRAQEQVDNSAGADGDEVVTTKRGVFAFANSTGDDAITIADIKGTAYIVDDQTVAKTDSEGTRSVAGEIWGVDADGVWIRF